MYKHWNILSAIATLPGGDLQREYTALPPKIDQGRLKQG
jgi:hypothetical protein